jgi:hypothetical protein
MTSFNDAKPVGNYTRKELIDLEHTWRLKLKQSGFSDIEKWDNKPNNKLKTIKFIKGHIRKSSYNNLRYLVPSTKKVDITETKDKEFDETLFWKGFELKASETYEYFRILGLFAEHSPTNIKFEKYREILYVYAQCGNRSKAIQQVDPTIKDSAIEMYLLRNFKHMLKFVNDLDREDSK